MRAMHFLAILLFGVIGLAGQERFVMPVDEAAQDASFLTFRTKLISAAERRDTKAILNILDPKVELSYGGHSGIADFKQMWKPDSRNSEFWAEFLKVIKNGGSWEELESRRIFSAPYTFAKFPEDLDFYDHYLIFGTDVNLRAKPDTTSESLAKLSYNVVKVDQENSTRKKTGPGENDWEIEWYRVETMGGKKGFVHASLLRSGIDYRAGFEKKGGVWKMIYFIAGD